MRDVFTYSISHAAMTIAPSGRTVLKLGRRLRSGPGKAPIKKAEDTLREDGTGRTIWQGSPYESAVDVSTGSCFLVAERWQEVWRDWFPNADYQSFAWRSLDTGELLHRTSNRIRFDPVHINASQTLVILSDGSVHQWPLRVNWPLLTLCQSILTLPLVLLWAILRLRRKRRARLAAAVQ